MFTDGDRKVEVSVTDLRFFILLPLIIGYGIHTLHMLAWDRSFDFSFFLLLLADICLTAVVIKDYVWAVREDDS